MPAVRGKARELEELSLPMARDLSWRPRGKRLQFSLALSLHIYRARCRMDLSLNTLAVDGTVSVDLVLLFRFLRDECSIDLVLFLYGGGLCKYKKSLRYY